MELTEKQQKRTLFPVLLTYFLDNFGLAIIYPIFTPLFLKSGHALVPEGSTYLQRTLLLGLLIASFPLAQFFGAPIIGQFSDRFGRKRAFFITILGTAIGYTLTAGSIMSHSLTFLFISRFLTGLFAGNLTLCLAAVADMSRDEISRTKNFGQIAAIGGLSFITAIAFGGLLSDASISRHFNPSLPFWVTAALAYINFFCMITLFHETHPTHNTPIHAFRGFHNILSALKRPHLRTIYSINFLFMLAWVGSMQFLPAFLIAHFTFHITGITFALMTVGAIWSLSNLFINRFLVKRAHPPQTLLICLLLLGILLLSIRLIHTPFSFFCLFIPAISCASLSWTNGLATVSLRSPAELQGSILGINQSMTSVAAMLSPAIGGLLVGISGYAVYLFSGAISLIAFLILFRSKMYIFKKND